eukprot:TRINITY_DN23585_c0_g1_i1.p1 TRINITY_DN23585_c0_g1~~TRINITY_DN23585_c0_g1_i1.p1  ORF type:complete len:228 (-),score=32.84 TRINITY_DN23585_c0_g1_i1:63-746(-)
MATSLGVPLQFHLLKFLPLKNHACHACALQRKKFKRRNGVMRSFTTKMKCNFIVDPHLEERPTFSFKQVQKAVKGNEGSIIFLQDFIYLLGVNAVASGMVFSAPAKAVALSEPYNLVGVTCGIILASLDPSLTKLVINILGPFLASFNILFIVRIVMSWYPQIPLGKFPYVIAYLPTEPFLNPTRKLIPPVAGVDVSPVVWFAIISFLNEVLLGQQGLLVLISQQKP